MSKEYSRFCEQEDEPFYPTNLSSDRKVLNSYREEMLLQKNIYFGGRLGSYQYLDMHMAIASALGLYENQIKKQFRIRD